MLRKSKAFPAKAIEKVLNRNGISLGGTKTAAVKYNEKEIEGTSLESLPEIEYEDVVEVEDSKYGERSYGKRAKPKKRREKLPQRAELVFQ